VLCNEDRQQQERGSVSTGRIGEYFNRKKGVELNNSKKSDDGILKSTNRGGGCLAI